MTFLPSQCASLQASFSAYLDGAVSGRQMQAIARHIEDCVSCTRELDGLRATQRTLAALGPARAPSDLGMRLRLAISHERADRHAGWFDSFSIKWENAVRPMLVQVSAGFAGAVMLIGTMMFLLGMVAAPQPVMANDVPLGAMTGPHFLYSASRPHDMIPGNHGTIVVEALVNDQGLVYDYNIVSGPEDATVNTQIVDQLLLSVFEPARVFGVPVRGRVVMTFAGISVQA